MKILSIECGYPGFLDVEAIVKNSLESGEKLIGFDGRVRDRKRSLGVRYQKLQIKVW